MSRPITKGSVDTSSIIRIVDSADGTPETGVTSATGGLDLKYRRQLSATVNLTESDLSALTDAHSDGGMLHIGAGYYRVDVPDAAFASGADHVLIFGTVTGMVVIGALHELVDAKITGDSYARIGALGAGLTALGSQASVDDVESKVDDLEGRLSAARAGYLDNLSAGPAALEATAQSILEDTVEIGTAGAGLTNINLPNQTMDITGNITGNLSGSVGSVTADVGITQGGADKVWSSAARSLTTFGSLVSDIATAVWAAATRRLSDGTNIVLAKGVGVTGFNDLSAAQVNAEVDTAISDAALATAANLATVAGYIDTEIGALITAVGDVPTNAELATALGTADDAVLAAIAALNNLSMANLASALATYDGPTKAELDSAVALLATAAMLTLVKAKTDPMTYGVAGALNVNATHINETEVDGTGVLGDEWRPAA